MVRRRTKRFNIFMSINGWQHLSMLQLFLLFSFWRSIIAEALYILFCIFLEKQQKIDFRTAEMIHDYMKKRM